MRVKNGASIEGCRREIVIAAIGIEVFFDNQGVKMVVTSGTGEEHHAVNSDHYKGDALDLRSKTVPDKQKLMAAVRRKVGKAFYIILESEGKPWEHFHFGYRPNYESML